MIKSLSGGILIWALATTGVLPACADETFTVSGTVKFDGAVTPVKPNKDVMNDPNCCPFHPKPPDKDTLVVDAEGGVKWTFVYVKGGLEKKEFDPPATPVTVDQVGCLYMPHLFGIMAGQPLEVRNSDPTLHNVHALPFANQEFNRAQLKGQVDRFKFTKPEIGVSIKCEVHPWMRTWACVVDHPYFAVTNAEGKFEIKNLPAGTYTLGVWHEGLKTKDGSNEVKVQVKGNQTAAFLMVKK